MKLTLVAAVYLIAIGLGLRPAVAEIPDDIRASLTARGHALLIGVSNYEKDRWPRLSSIDGDVEDLKKGLSAHFATVEVLKNATSDQIRAKLRDFLIRQWNQPDGRLLIYYAGHGFNDFNPN